MRIFDKTVLRRTSINGLRIYVSDSYVGSRLVREGTDSENFCLISSRIPLRDFYKGVALTIRGSVFYGPN